jgi:beta-lactam-binding protein with PASTA domain
MDIKKYFSKALLYNVLIAIGILILLILIVQWGLKSYTRHGESTTVPKLIGSTLNQVEDILGQKKLDYQIMDSTFDMSKPPMTIVDQNPKPGSKVKEGRTVYLTINAANAPLTEVPDLVGKSSFKFAKLQLQSYGLAVGEPVYRPDPHFNSVIGLEIDGKPVTKKMKVPRGTVVTLILGNGLGNTRYQVPYVIGQSYSDAEFFLKGNSLNVVIMSVGEGVTDTSSAIVVRQNPPYGPGNSIRIGEALELWLARELPADIEVNPDLYGKIDTLGSE